MFSAVELIDKEPSVAETQWCQGGIVGKHVRSI